MFTNNANVFLLIAHFQNVPASVKEGLTIVYVEDMRQVIQVVFKGTKVAERMEIMVPLEENLKIDLPL